MRTALFLLVFASLGTEAALTRREVRCPGLMGRVARFAGYDWTAPLETYGRRLQGRWQLSETPAELTLHLAIWGNRTRTAVPAVPGCASWRLSARTDIQKALTAALEGWLTVGENAEALRSANGSLAYRGLLTGEGSRSPHRPASVPPSYPLGDKFQTEMMKQTFGPTWLQSVPLVPGATHEDLDGFLIERFEIPAANGTTTPFYAIYDAPQRAREGRFRIVVADPVAAAKITSRITAVFGEDPLPRRYTASVFTQGARRESPFAVAPNLVALLGKRLGFSADTLRTQSLGLLEHLRRAAYSTAVADFFEKKIADDTGLSRRVLAALRDPTLSGEVESINDLSFLAAQSSGFATAKRDMEAKIDRNFSGYQGRAAHRIQVEIEIAGRYRLEMRSDEFQVDYLIHPDGTITIEQTTLPAAYHVTASPLDRRSTAADAEISGLANLASQALLLILSDRR